MTRDLFEEVESDPDPLVRTEPLAEGAVVLRHFARAVQAELLEDIRAVLVRAPLRQLSTARGLKMSVAMTNCGALGWVSDNKGYRYVATDPASGLPWPEMPRSFSQLAVRCAAAAGFEGVRHDACLINRYVAGARLSLHQDRDERDLRAPIVSVSLGVAAHFLFGGLRRGDPVDRLVLGHGDVVVWGGPARMRFHGVAPLADGMHPVVGAQRFNLTFRKAG